MGEGLAATPGGADAALEHGDEEVLHHVVRLVLEIAEQETGLVNEPRVQLARDGVHGLAVAVDRAPHAGVEVEDAP